MNLILVHPTQECAGLRAGSFEGISAVLSAPQGRDISAQGKCGGASRQTSPWGSLFVRGEALKGRDKRLLTEDCCPGQVSVVSPFQGLRLMPPYTQGGAALALG
jgi:hypothetical protein